MILSVLIVEFLDLSIFPTNIKIQFKKPIFSITVSLFSRTLLDEIKNKPIFKTINII